MDTDHVLAPGLGAEAGHARSDDPESVKSMQGPEDRAVGHSDFNFGRVQDDFQIQELPGSHQPFEGPDDGFAFRHLVTDRDASVDDLHLELVGQQRVIRATHPEPDLDRAVSVLGGTDKTGLHAQGTPADVEIHGRSQVQPFPLVGQGRTDEFEAS